MASPYEYPSTIAIRLPLRSASVRSRDVAASPRDEDQPVLEIGLREEQRALALGVLPRRGAAVELAAEQGGRELRGVDDCRAGLDADAAKAGLDEVERKARLPGSLVNGDHAVDTRRNCVVCADTATDSAASDSTKGSRTQPLAATASPIAGRTS